MEQTAGGVTAAKGFMAAGVAAGVKYKDRKDMALIYSERPCMVAGVFTSNVVKAAPVLWDREIVSAGRDVHGVIVNAGIANACTGAQGYDYCRRTAAAAAAAAAWLRAGDYDGGRWAGLARLGFGPVGRACVFLKQFHLN